MNIFKHLSTLVLLLAGFFPTNAQSIYAPIGAEWYNEMEYGAYHSYVKGDTVINGISCRIISQEAMYFSVGSSGYGYSVSPSQKNIYLYATSDSVFIYNTIFRRFTPIFVFNVNAGDTVHLPIVPLQGCRFFNSIAPDSMFHFVVDSIVMVSYDNMPLKTVYSHTITTSGAYYKWGEPNVYAQLLGSLSSNILPNCVNCGQCLGENFTITPGRLRCYHDNTHQVNLIDSGNCNNGATAISQAVKADLDFDLYPNPADDKIYINNRMDYKIATVGFQSAME